MDQGSGITRPAAAVAGADDQPHAFHPGRFYSLDLLRGLGAICVVFWHWSNFYLFANPGSPMEPKARPLYSLFFLPYNEGWRAVYLFFSLSGFIFYWLYEERIAAGRISWREFGVFRFSRLYPLHLVTLLFVAAAQWIFWARFGQFYIYRYNDVGHFILQLFLATNWVTPGQTSSFNGPVWSVSVEVLLYALFFLLCLAGWRRWWQLVLVVLAGYSLGWVNLPEPASGIVSFFIGGLAYKTFAALSRRGLTWRLAAALIVLTALLAILVPLNSHYRLLWQYYQGRPYPADAETQSMDLGGTFIRILSEKSWDVILFPLIILTLAVGESLRGGLGRRLAFIGDISYSTYLIHFPLQMVFMFTALEMALPRSVFNSVWMLAAFFAVLFPLALASYHYLERPAQSYLRRKLLPPGKGNAR